MVRTCSTHEAKSNAYRILVVKSEGKRPLGRPYVGGRIILKWTINMMEFYGLDCSG
jgi:hypothetical protein